MIARPVDESHRATTATTAATPTAAGTRTRDGLEQDMGTDDFSNRWTLRGDPALLMEAATALRGARAEQIFDERFPGEYVLSGVARLLESLAHEMRIAGDDSALSHAVVSAATDISGHVLRYLPELRDAAVHHRRTSAGTGTSGTSPWPS
ncbi:hypothetical protein [Pseudonocardia yuanmonensis]